MSIQQVKFRATDYLLPPALIDLAKTNEKAMTVTATLVLNLFKQVIQIVQRNQPPNLDAFPGDRQCHDRNLLILPDLLENPEILEELKALEVKITAALTALNRRSGKQVTSSLDFFEKEIASLTISRDVRFLMDCRLLMVTRQPQPAQPSGRVISKSEPGNLTQLSKKFHEIENRGIGNNFREQITQRASTRISAETVVRRQEYSRRMIIPELLKSMIEEFVIFKPDNYPPKSFGCQFFTLQLALYRLLEKNTPLAIKTIVPKGDPHLIFFKAGQNDFEFQNLIEVAQLPKTSYVGIIEAIVPSEENLLTKIEKIGFIELLLRYAAQEPPYQPGTRSEDVKNPQGRQMLEAYRETAADSGCNEELLFFHHVYLNTLQDEIKNSSQFNFLTGTSSSGGARSH